MLPETAPRISIIIPAWNEARWLPNTLAAVRQAMAGIDEPREVIVVDNASSDSTVELARPCCGRPWTCWPAAKFVAVVPGSSSTG